MLLTWSRAPPQTVRGQCKILKLRWETNWWPCNRRCLSSLLVSKAVPTLTFRICRLDFTFAKQKWKFLVKPEFQGFRCSVCACVCSFQGKHTNWPSFVLREGAFLKCEYCQRLFIRPLSCMKGWVCLFNKISETLNWKRPRRQKSSSWSSHPVRILLAASSTEGCDKTMKLFFKFNFRGVELIYNVCIAPNNLLSHF